MYSIKIKNKIIGLEEKPFVIAEMSGNHNQSLERALSIIEAAANCGADAIKIQTYTADTMTIDLTEKEFMVSDKQALWGGQSLYKLYQQAYTPWEWHKPMLEHARKHGILLFSTPFDISAVEFLESLDMPLYKIASFENTDLPLIRKVASTKKPLIISTGMASIAEIDEAVRCAQQAGCREIVLLKCTSAYPAPVENCNVATISHMREMTGCLTGISDHTLGIGASVAATALGACVIEKHFTLSRAEGGVDAAFSLEPEELRSLVVESALAKKAVGRVSYGLNQAEKDNLVFRRSLYITENLKAGDTVSKSSLRSIRPGYGLPPKWLDMLLGRKVKNDVKKGTAVTWDLFQ